MGQGIASSFHMLALALASNGVDTQSARQLFIRETSFNQKLIFEVYFLCIPLLIISSGIFDVKCILHSIFIVKSDLWKLSLSKFCSFSVQVEISICYQTFCIFSFLRVIFIMVLGRLLKVAWGTGKLRRAFIATAAVSSLSYSFSTVTSKYQLIDWSSIGVIRFGRAFLTVSMIFSNLEMWLSYD